MHSKILSQKTFLQARSPIQNWTSNGLETLKTELWKK